MIHALKECNPDGKSPEDSKIDSVINSKNIKTKSFKKSFSSNYL